MKHYKFSITFKSELLLGQSKTPMTSRRSRSLVFAVCGSIVHEHGWSCNGWLSRCGTAWVSRTSSKFRQAFMFAMDPDQWQFAIAGYVSQHHDGSVPVGMSSLDTGRVEMLIGAFRRPQGSSYMVYPSGIPRTVLPGISKIRPVAAAFIPTKEVPIHAIVEHRSYLLWLPGGNTAIQTPRTVGIYKPWFRHYRLDYHNTWQKWSRRVNFKVWKVSQKYDKFYWI